VLETGIVLIAVSIVAMIYKSATQGMLLCIRIYQSIVLRLVNILTSVMQILSRWKGQLKWAGIRFFVLH